MGEVWRGTDQILGRPVAIKLLAAAHASDEQFRARFRAEARYAAALSHPLASRGSSTTARPARSAARTWSWSW